MVRKRHALVLGLLVALSGCGTTNQDVITKFQPQFAERRTQIQSIADKLPASVAEDSKCSGLSPTVLFDRKAKQFNTELLMLEQAKDPDAKPEFDLLANGDLLLALEWTGPKNPMSDSSLKSRVDGLDKNLQSALDYRYVVIHRVANLALPVASDESHYSDGNVTLEGFVVDLQKNEIMCSYKVEGQPSEELNFSVKEGEDAKERLEAFARSSMWEDVRAKTQTALRDATGGTIELEDH